MKKIFIFLTALNFFSTEIIKATVDDFQFWFTPTFEKRSDQRYKAAIDGEFRFKNNMSKLEYAHIEPSLLFRIRDNYFAGGIFRILGTRTAVGDWKRQVEVGPIFFVSGPAGKFQAECRGQLFFCLAPSSHLHAAVRLRPGITLFSDNHCSFYLQNEFFYNQNNFQEYDQNRFTVGLKCNYFAPFEFCLYYLRQENKTAKDVPFQGANILGLQCTVPF